LEATPLRVCFWWKQKFEIFRLPASHRSSNPSVHFKLTEKAKVQSLNGERRDQGPINGKRKKFSK
jgi:hypothetical protein